MKLYVIGCGGTASYLLPVLVRMLTRTAAITELVLVDRDQLETKNLKRQLFNAADVDRPKVEALAEKLQEVCPVLVSARVEWFDNRTDVEEGSFIICACDNHPARLAVLEKCDQTYSQCVICGNEKISGDAYYYSDLFKDTPADPRIRYPEIVTTKTDDPTRPACNSVEAMEVEGQTAQANAISASLGMQLVHLWLFEIERYDLKEHLPMLPIEHMATLTKVRTLSHKDVMES